MLGIQLRTGGRARVATLNFLSESFNGRRPERCCTYPPPPPRFRVRLNFVDTYTVTAFQIMYAYFPLSLCLYFFVPSSLLRLLSVGTGSVMIIVSLRFFCEKMAPNNNRFPRKNNAIVAIIAFLREPPPKSKQLQLLISWVLDELEKRRFQHLTQNGQDFFKLQYKILASSVSCRSRKSQYFRRKNSATSPRLNLDNF
jgi:hypothetical protein